MNISRGCCPAIMFTMILDALRPSFHYFVQPVTSPISAT